MKEIIHNFLDKGYLISPDFLENLDEFFKEEDFLSELNLKIQGRKPLILNKEILHVILRTHKIININWREFEKSKAFVEKGKNGKIYKTFLDILQYEINENKRKELDNILEETKKEENVEIEPDLDFPNNVIIIDKYKETEKKREIQDFVKYYKHRYNAIKEILQGRLELKNPISINRLSNKNRGEPVSIIGVVGDKKITKNGNITLTIEDPTGSILVLITKDKLDLFSIAKNLVPDEVIGINGSYGSNLLFGNEILFPDIPLNKEFKKSKDETYAVFISDIHVGSKMFLPDDFKKFIDWTNGNYGNSEQKRIAKKVKYLFIAGDLVDGVGIYPEQDKELNIKDIKDQYQQCADYLSQIRKDIKIIICPGNHDALRIAEPQPILNPKFAEPLFKLKNITLVTNPSLINIHSSKDFPGFDVLLYHGYSFDYYASNVDTIRINGGYDRADLIMKFLLQKRHLAPTHGSTLYIPDTTKDPLVISKIPDFFVSGHIHKANTGNYKNITTICCSCWQSKTTFQEKVGHIPEPSRVPIVNLKTREVKILKFES